mmetsp:Transcript_70933/g.122960  ORF Transcript_70933/g.122960 Transcript_70933/m.122960 type:complete len:310 (+) Transcript_70933:71-1000(+)
MAWGEAVAQDNEVEVRAAPRRTQSGKRMEYLSWDDYFMSVAFLTAMRSKDPSTQVGACIVNEQNRIVGVGYNGFPSGIADEALPWAKEAPDGELSTKHPYVCHAELNAVLNKNAESCRGCRLYTTLFPCNECAKVIIQAGIRRVVYASDKHRRRISDQASRRLFSLAGVETRQHKPEAGELRISLRYREDEPLPEPASQNSPPTSPLKTTLLSSSPLAGGSPVSPGIESECQPCGQEFLDYHNAEIPVELLRQWADYGGWYYPVVFRQQAEEFRPQERARQAPHWRTPLAVGVTAVLLGAWLRWRPVTA